MKNRLKEKYTQVDNNILNLKNISLKAKGLYAFLCSKPNNWNFSYKWLIFQLQEWEKAIRSAVKELVNIEILLRIPKKEWNSFTGWDWIINPNKNDLLNRKDPLSKIPKKEVPKKATTQDGNEINKTEESKTNINNTNIIITSENKFSENTFNYKVCKEFLDAHKKRKSISVVTMLKNNTEEEIIEKWADVVRKFLKIDKFEEKHIERVFKFTYTSDQWLSNKDFEFWQNNFQTVMKFRDRNNDKIRYFEFMIDKMRQNKPAVLAYYNLENPDLIDDWI